MPEEISGWVSYSLHPFRLYPESSYWHRSLWGLDPYVKPEVVHVAIGTRKNLGSFYKIWLRNLSLFWTRLHRWTVQQQAFRQPVVASIVTRMSEFWLLGPYNEVHFCDWSCCNGLGTRTCINNPGHAEASKITAYTRHAKGRKDVRGHMGRTSWGIIIKICTIYQNVYHTYTHLKIGIFFFLF